jgi:hypothetical protein
MDEYRPLGKICQKRIASTNKMFGNTSRSAAHFSTYNPAGNPAGRVNKERNTIMNCWKLPGALVVVVVGLASCIGWAVAFAAPGDTPATPGRIYTAHTPEVGGCPALDWHIVVGGANTLSGMVGVEDMKTVFRVTGSYSGATLRLDGTEVGGTRTAAVNGAVRRMGVSP